MSSVKKVLTIRVSGKERKQKVRRLLYDFLHFRNLLIIFINKYRLIFKETLLNQSILYGLLTENGYTGKYKENFGKVLENINTNRELAEFLDKLRAQKKKAENAPLIQSVIRQVIKDFKSYFKALKKFSIDPSSFTRVPQPPKPKKLRLLMNFSVEANANIFKQEKNYLLIRLREGKYLKVKLPRDFPYRVSSVRLKFFGDDLYVDAVYECSLETKQSKGNFKAGVDVGLDELLSVVSENPELKSFIVSGREIKAFNQWFNKEKAKLQSQMDCLKNELKNEMNCGKEDLNRLKRKLYELEIKSKVLSAYRKRWIDTQFHRIARKVVDLLYETGHKVIYIGKSALESKNGINLGRKINQAFVSIPLRRLIELIKYKAQELGMEVVEVNESYTSKTSPFVDVEKVQETKDFKGERKGNLFRDRVLNKVFHADLVGALNILRRGAKLPKLEFYDNLKVLFVKLCNPVRLKLMDLFFKVTSESLLLGGIGGSRREILSPAGLNLRTEKSNYLNAFCS